MVRTSLRSSAFTLAQQLFGTRRQQREISTSFEKMTPRCTRDGRLANSIRTYVRRLPDSSNLDPFFRMIQATRKTETLSSHWRTASPIVHPYTRTRNERKRGADGARVVGRLTQAVASYPHGKTRRFPGSPA